MICHPGSTVDVCSVVMPHLARHKLLANIIHDVCGKLETLLLSLYPQPFSMNQENTRHCLEQRRCDDVGKCRSKEFHLQDEFGIRRENCPWMIHVPDCTTGYSSHYSTTFSQIVGVHPAAPHGKLHTLQAQFMSRYVLCMLSSSKASKKLKYTKFKARHGDSFKPYAVCPAAEH